MRARNDGLQPSEGNLYRALPSKGASPDYWGKFLSLFLSLIEERRHILPQSQ